MKKSRKKISTPDVSADKSIADKQLASSDMDTEEDATVSWDDVEWYLLMLSLLVTFLAILVTLWKGCWESAIVFIALFVIFFRDAMDLCSGLSSEEFTEQTQK